MSSTGSDRVVVENTKVPRLRIDLEQNNLKLLNGCCTVSPAYKATICSCSNVGYALRQSGLPDEWSRETAMLRSMRVIKL